MAINLTNLFTGLGHLYYPLLRAHTYIGGNLSTSIDGAVTGMGTTYADVGGSFLTAKDGLQSQASAQLGQTIRTLAGNYLTRVVNADTPLADRNSVSLALAELIRQMKSQSYKVPAPTISASASALSTNVGTGSVVLTTKNPFGLSTDNQFAETGILQCTGDAQAATATAGSEPFQYRGDYAPPDVMRWDWPGYSGASASLTAIDAGGTANLLANGDFEDWTVTNTPDNWTLGAGVAGTDIFREASVIYAGTYAVKFLGTGSVRPILRQTLTTLKPNRVYAVNCWLRASASHTTAANLKIRLVDGSNTTITDDQSAENGITQDLTTLTTAYVAKTGVLITPKTLPAVVKVQIEASNGANLVSTEAVYLDHLAMADATFLYPGGPGAAVFSGATAFMTGDGWDVTTANDQNSATYGATWQRVFDRLFGMRQLQLLLPTAGSNSLSDALIA